MSNLLEISNSVFRNLDDLGANFFDRNQDIVPSIQDGYNLVAALCETIENSETIPFESGLVIYDLSARIPDYLRIYGVYNNNTGRWMHPTTNMELYSIRDNWEATNGEPYLFLPLGYKHIALFPVPGTASGNMTVLYKAKADTLLANTEPQVPQEQQNVLEFFSTSDMLTQCEEFVKALQWAGMMQTSVESIRKVMRERSSPNQLYFHREVY